MSNQASPEPSHRRAIHPSARSTRPGLHAPSPWSRGLHLVLQISISVQSEAFVFLCVSACEAHSGRLGRQRVASPLFRECQTSHRLRVLERRRVGKVAGLKSILVCRGEPAVKALDSIFYVGYGDAVHT